MASFWFVSKKDPQQRGYEVVARIPRAWRSLLSEKKEVPITVRIYRDGSLRASEPSGPYSEVVLSGGPDALCDHLVKWAKQEGLSLGDVLYEWTSWSNEVSDKAYLSRTVSGYSGWGTLDK
jgi:hypothetical protein